MFEEGGRRYSPRLTSVKTERGDTEPPRATQERARRDGTLGVRQFVVGSGGKNHQLNRAAQPNSEIRNVTDFGVLELALGATSYRWQCFHSHC